MRFLLSPPPEEDRMATRQQPPRAAKQPKEVFPTDPKGETERFGPANKWGKKQLDWLGVKFSLKKRVDLNTILNVDESQWPPAIRTRTFF